MDANLAERLAQVIMRVQMALPTNGTHTITIDPAFVRWRLVVPTGDKDKATSCLMSHVEILHARHLDLLAEKVTKALLDQ